MGLNLLDAQLENIVERVREAGGGGFQDGARFEVAAGRSLRRNLFTGT